MFESGELEGMREAQEDFMMDTCQIGRSIAAQDAYHAATEQHVWSTEVDCGLEMSAGTFRRTPDLELVIYDGILRLAHDTDISAGDHVRITKRFGTAIDPFLEFEVMSPARVGPSGLRVLLKEVKP